MSECLRKRSMSYEIAHECFLKVADVGMLKLPKLLEEKFVDWNERYLNPHYCRLFRGNTFVFVRMLNRFCDEYRKRIWKKLSGLAWFKSTTMLTLTVDPKRFIRLANEYDLIVKVWNKLRYVVTRKFGSFKFIRVLELQKTGRPHLHILTDLPYSEELEKFIYKHWWKWIGYATVRKVYEKLNALSYVVKYVKKTICGKGLSNAYAALLFASNKRMWSVSRSLLVKSPKSNSNKVDAELEHEKFKFDGVIAGSVFHAFVDEFQIKLSEVTVIEYDVEKHFKWALEVFNLEY